MPRSSSRYWRNELGRDLERFKDRPTFVWLNELSLTDMLKRASALPPHSVILYLGLSVDAKAVQTEAVALAQLHAAANAPIFGVYNTQIGRGVVGGPLVSIADLSRNSTDVALRLLRGDSPGSIRMDPLRHSQPTYDWRELRRWGISEARLPAGSIVQFRQPGVWDQYKLYIAGAVVLLGLQSALIATLLVQHARRARAERALRESEERFRLMANGAPVMVWTAAPDMKTDFFNSTVLEFTGLPIEQLLGDGWLERIHADDLEQCVQAYVPAFEARQPFQMEYRFRRADGTYRWILDTGVPRNGPDGRFAGYIGSALDITERREMEQSIRANQAALRQAYEQNQDLAGRLINAQEAERTRIARDLHDDVSQQLAGVGIMLSGLKRTLNRSGPGPEVDETMGALQERTATLAHAIRHLSHDLHPGMLKHSGLAAALTQHCAEIQRHHGLTVSVDARDDLDAIAVDVALCLYRVTQEALTNVVRHARARSVVVELLQTRAGVELRITDDGIGFVATERARSGLGLRSIDERVRLTGGNVSVESRPGQGTKVLVRIPVTAAPLELARGS